MVKIRTLANQNIEKLDQKEFLMLVKILQEYQNAKRKHHCLKSRHEGYAVILEELDETWEVIKKGAGESTVLSEIQAVGAMVLRFMVDLL